MEERQLGKIEIIPIGVVSRISLDENDRDKSLVARIVLNKDLTPALDGIEEWSHLYVIFWLDRVAQTTPPVLHHPSSGIGIFAARLMRAFGLKHMINEVVNDRAGSALYITVFAVIVLAEIAAILILKAEAPNPADNITSAGDAVWSVFVTNTAVGYGDFYPTTEWGRIIGIFVMSCGIALLGVLTSFLASFFIAPSKKREEELHPMIPRPSWRNSKPCWTSGRKRTPCCA